MPKRRHHSQGYQARREGQLGMTLVHMLAYVTVLAVVINLGATLFVAVLRMHDAGTSALDESLATRDIETELRDTVSEAVAVRTAIGGYQSSADTALLELPPDAETGAARYAALQRLAQNGGLVLRKLELQQAPGGLTVAYMKTYGPVFNILEFEYPGDLAAARALSIRFSLKAGENPQREAHVHSITTALGGIGGAL